MGRYAFTGVIKYGDVDRTVNDRPVDDGVLIYIKPAFYATEPLDVLNYANSHAAFPHETTADQFFRESQFESYRALGCHEIGALCARLARLDKDAGNGQTSKVKTLSDFRESVTEYLR